MKFILLILFSLAIGKDVEAQTQKEATVNIRQGNIEIQAILDRYTRLGIPGAAIAVYSASEGYWGNTSGYAKLEDSIKLQMKHLQYLQSVTKMYLAVAVLKLQEQGKLRLDDHIGKYLPLKYSRHIQAVNEISIRMLLNHTSGVPEYSTNPGFVSFVVQHPLKKFLPEQQLGSISGKPLLFTPGSRYSYTNTNYLLLALITDAITGSHEIFINKEVFKPLGLKETFYRQPGYLEKRDLVASYWDVLNTGYPANITGLQKTNVSSMIGDDGMVCTATDAVKAIDGVMSGRILSAASMAEMQNWVKDEQGNIRYGMGLAYYRFADVEAYGHGGGGLGAGCILLYFPKQKRSVFLAVNLGVLVESKLTNKIEEMKAELLMVLLK